MRRRDLLALPILALPRLAIAQPRSNGQMWVYLGTYTGPKSRGIYVSRFDPTAGTLANPELAAETASPSFLAVHPSRDFLFAVNEVGEFGGEKAGSVSAFAMDRTAGKLTMVNQQSSRGGSPCHIVCDSKGRHVLVANYTGGNVAVLPVGTDGRLGPSTGFVQHTGSSVNKDRQTAPHAHSINLDASNRFAYVADLGLDKVLIYRFDGSKGTLAAANPSAATLDPGAGPRHFALHPSGRHAYVINELTCTITTFRRDARTAGLETIQTISTLPDGQSVAKGFSTAEVQVHPSGRFLYGSNRGHDSIAVFAIDGKTGRLTAVQHEPTQGSTPRNFGIDPTGAFLLAANQRSDSVVVFRIDTRTGRLTPTGAKIEVGSPVCVKFVRIA